MSTVIRVKCPHCEAECMEQESVCWQCGKRLRELPPKSEPETPEPAQDDSKIAKKPFWQKTKTPPPPPKPIEAPITFTGMFAEQQEAARPEPEPEPEQPRVKTVTTLTGEVVEVPDDAPAEGDFNSPTSNTAATIGGTTVAAVPEAPVFILTFCKACGYQNPEGVKECMKCKSLLETVLEPPK